MRAARGRRRRAPRTTSIFRLRVSRHPKQPGCNLPGTSVTSALPAYVAGLAATDAYAQTKKGAVRKPVADRSGRRPGRHAERDRQRSLCRQRDHVLQPCQDAHVCKGWSATPITVEIRGFVGWRWIKYPGIRMPVQGGRPDANPAAPQPAVCLRHAELQGRPTYAEGISEQHGSDAEEDGRRDRRAGCCRWRRCTSAGSGWLEGDRARSRRMAQLHRLPARPTGREPLAADREENPARSSDRAQQRIAGRTALRPARIR